MFVLTLVLASMVILAGLGILTMKKDLQGQKKCHAELHDRYSMLWADYTRRGQRIMLYEAGMSKDAVDELDRNVKMRIEKFAENEKLSDR